MISTGLPPATGTEDVCRTAADLIRIDTTNHGNGRAVGEAVAADYIEEFLQDIDIPSRRYEKAPGRSNLIARLPGEDPSLPALILDGHLDVVPADDEDWSVDPFGGVIMDGMLWGRGAVDMKGMVGMILAAARSLTQAERRPRRDVILAFLADEEDNSHYGARWLVEEYPEVFGGAECAIGEVGGFSVDLAGNPAFLVQTGEKGILWLRLRATGRVSHGSQVNKDANAIATLARAVVRVCDEPWPTALTDTTSAMLAALREALDAGEDADPYALIETLGPCSTFISPGLSTVANTTMLNAGYKENVVPGEATAFLDVRYLPGQRDSVLARIQELVGEDVEVEIADDVPALETGFDGEIVDAMRGALTTFVPQAKVLPYLVPAGTDNPMFARLGIRGFGFSPLLLPPGFDFPSMFHGVDERVPLDALVFGTAVLQELLLRY